MLFVKQTDFYAIQIFLTLKWSTSMAHTQLEWKGYVSFGSLFVAILQIHSLLKFSIHFSHKTLWAFSLFLNKRIHTYFFTHSTTTNNNNYSSSDSNNNDNEEEDDDNTTHFADMRVLDFLFRMVCNYICVFHCHFTLNAVDVLIDVSAACAHIDFHWIEKLRSFN